jgi:hypothetical protein
MTASSLNQAEMTKHLRKRIHFENIPARVRMFGASIQVIVPEYGFKWTADQLRLIGRIAKGNHMTLVRGLPVTEDHFAEMTGWDQIDLYMGVD